MSEHEHEGKKYPDTVDFLERVIDVMLDVKNENFDQSTSNVTIGDDGEIGRLMGADCGCGLYHCSDLISQLADGALADTGMEFYGFNVAMQSFFGLSCDHYQFLFGTTLGVRDAYVNLMIMEPVGWYTVQDFIERARILISLIQAQDAKVKGA